MESRRKAFFIFCIVCLISAVQSCTKDPTGTLNDLDLRSPETISDYWDDGEGDVLNDDQLTSGWYRAVQNGWQYMLVDDNAIPDFVTCSTYWPIYLKGNHTPVDNITGNPISAEVCVRDVLQPCITTYEIQIRKCDGEIQYKLEGTLWFSAFCFYKGFQLPKNGTLVKAPENVNFGTVVVTPELHFKEEPRNGAIVNLPYIKFRCKFEEQEGLFYSVTWNIDKTKFVETMEPSRNLDSLTLAEDKLLANNISLGKQIQCGVSASSTVNGLQTNVTFSLTYYAGIKVLNTTILLDKQSSAIVQMVSSVPIGCRYVKLSNGKIPKAACKTAMKLFVDNSDQLQCEKGSVLNKIPKEDASDNQMCSKYLPTLTEADTWNPDTLFNFSIVTSDHNYNDTSKFILKLQFPKTIGHAIWKNYLFPDITVLVQNKDLYKKKICMGRTDPHMYTFDGYGYGQQNEGTYIMYQHQQNGIEIQQKTKQCADRVGTCICGIAVSAGQDIFMINRCSTAVFFGFTQCGDGGILQVVKRSDIRYRVLTPIGTRIEIHLRLKWINVDIYAAPKDMGNVLGLCGKIDGDRKNDLQHRRSTRTSPLYGGNHYDFIRSWKIDDDSEDNLFSQNFKTREKWMQRNGLYCVCQKNDIALCSPSQFLNCTMKDSITKTKCHIEGRRKRSTGYQSDKEIRRLLSLMTERGHRVKREAESTLIITSESIQLCEKKIQGSLAMTEYKNISANEDQTTVVEWCAFDISATNDTRFADVHVEAINEGVKNMIDLQPVYAAKNTEEIEVFLKNTCPLNCTDRGICSDEGKCLCFTYFHGPDCSIDERDALNILDIQGGGECDLADGDDCECFYVRSDRIQENFTCTVNTSKILINGNVELVSEDTIKGGYEDIFTGICCVPENIIGVNDVFVAVYGVSISNNGYNFGNRENVYVFDTKCQEVEDTPDNTKVFSLKDKRCFIDGYCFSDKDMAPKGCLACNSTISKLNWTEYNPCQNGGLCKDDSSGYMCMCIEGYGGINCEYEVNECDSAPCENDGNCTDEFNGYSCTCLGGFAGAHCEINIDECSSQPCKNGGICKDQINQYECICNAGYEGTNCEFDIDECSSNPCQNQGTCSDYVNGYTCTCASGFFGVQCQTNIDDCVSNPCQNRGTCVDGDDGRICTCLEGYQGVNCEINTNECLSNPCQNGGSCVDAENMYTCTCVAGFTGTDCETDINECSSTPCLNGGTCVDALNMYTCDCAPGYTGLICEEEMNECSSNPCKNGGSCVDELNMFRCNCTSGYSGEICETDIDECLSNPCQNGGSCVDAENMYTCTCVTGFTDTLCETDIDECSTDPCLNGGTCVDAVNFYTCRCAAGYTGIDCGTEINECYSAPCLNGGSCVDEVDSFKCNCTSGFTGDTCETDINECLSNPCQNGGRCVDAANMYTCACVAGFTGLECETDIIECSSAPCLNGGTCVDALNMYTCDCVAGFTGLNCEAEIDECASGPCLNGAKCVNEVNSFQCDCVSGYYGETCETEINECSSEPCLNGGSCVDEVNRFQCNCTSGYTGERCETDINECLTNPCQNGGSCVDAVNSYTCTCVAGFTGPECETDINECSSSPCFNGGICIDALNMYTCDCAAGYTGIHCEAEVNECSSGPCLNGGSCVNEVNRFQCNCASGYTGERCETDINECLSNPCQNGGSCVDAVNIYTCTCVAGFTGQECETEVNECSSEPCLNGGSCVNEVNRFQCHCASGYTGERCETDINECSSSPCLNGGICRDALNMYTCDCAAGYTGIHCEAEINECSSEPCLNGGSCVNEVNKFQCHCASGYTGERCETDINECLSNPCQNGGSCVDAVNMYTCTCVAGFTGQECETDINECTSSPCLNGGICIDALNMYTCDCAAGYTGIHCEAEVNECSSEPCLNGGSCVNEVNWFQCNCASGYTGERCETEIKECSSSPCLNGGICVDEVNGFHCNCASGFTGEMCETDIDECSSDPCQNGGICANGINGYTCTCAAGYRGNNCEADIDECSVNPCRNGGSCVDGLNKYTCTCVAGYEGDYCEIDIDECSPNPCKNGGKCVDGINRYTCKCADGYEGKDCGSDIDECSPNPCQNGGSCIDSINHYICLCLRGYGGVNCDSRSISSSKISLVLPVTINHVLLSDSHIKQNIRAELIKHFQGKLGNSFKDVTILQLRYGSLIVDFIINYDNKSTAAKELAKATTELVSGEAKIELLNETVSATAVTIDDTTVTTEALHEPGTLCKIYIALNGECTNNFECVDEEDAPNCVPTKSKFGLTVLIVVIVCSMVSLIFVSAAICVYVRVYRVRHGKFMISTDFDAGKDEIQDCPPDHQT